VTVREWFRTLRTTYKPLSSAEENLLLSLRDGDLKTAEFWGLLFISEQVERYRDVRGHLWRLDGYTWRCENCPATIISEDLDETSPPDQYDPECLCRSCRPCKGDGQ
jgi:hypothetical protein